MTSGIAIFQLSYSIPMLSYWFLRSPARPTAECASCSLSRASQTARNAFGGRRSKRATSTLKSPPELCPMAAKTVLLSCWSLPRSSCRAITSSSVSTRAATIEHPCCAHSVSWALRL